MTDGSFQPIVGKLKDPVPVLENRIELLEKEVRSLHQRLLATRRQLASLQGEDPQLALDELIHEFERAEAERLKRELEAAQAAVEQARAGKDEPETGEDKTEAEQELKKKKKRRGHGPRRQSLLPVTEKLHELDEESCQCKVCGGKLAEMGDQFESFEEITVFERRYVKVVHKRRKYRCSCNACVETAPGPLRLIPGGRYSPEFAIHVAEQKYLDHLPLERLVRIMKRLYLDVTASTLWDQLNALAKLLSPTYYALGQKVLEAPVLHADETRWPLLNGQSQRSWTAWTLSTHDIAHYSILSSKSTKSARRLFSGYSGIIVADGYAVYEKLQQAGPNIELANCWAHVLRKFRDLESTHPKIGHDVLKLIGQLYRLEKQVPGPFPGNKSAQSSRTAIRRDQSALVIKELKDYLEQVVGLPRGDLGKAVKYTLKRWKGLTLFLNDPLIPLDNNAAERALRGLVVGRKNHYGSKTKRGTEVAAIFYTLFETAKLSGINPVEYLRLATKRALENPGAVTLPQDLQEA